VQSRNVLEQAADRSRVGLGDRARRLRTLLPTLLMAAVAAGIAWEIALRAFGARGAFFAPVAAVITLGLTVGERVRRAIELSVGVPLGMMR